ncbi:MAG: TOMM precursor leader peptide-binding protein, partial [Pseudonocardia sp.]
PAEVLADATARGADTGQAASLLQRLWHAGALIDAAAEDRRAQRLAASVALVLGTGPLAAGIAAGLADAGLGAVHVAAAAAGPRTRDHVRTGGGVAADRRRLGTVAHSADSANDHPDAPAVDPVTAAVRRTAPVVRTGPLPQRILPDVAVLADALVPDPAHVVALTADGIPHLTVQLRDGAGVVGPLVLPGRTACLHCLEMHRRDHDPGWRSAAAALAGSTGQAHPACAAATVAVGTAQALAALDAGSAVPPPALGATLVVDPASATITRRPWEPHPGCCGWLSTGVALRPGTP